MTKHESRKRRLGGIAIATAHKRLIRALLFRELSTSNKNYCFRCGQPMTLANFSVEHTQGWKSYEDYMYLDDIAYSHHSCNASAGAKEQVR